MHVNSIFKALEGLDPDNDDHWTADGAPRLDVLEPTLPGVTRQHLLRAAPLFNRKHTELPDLAAEREAAEKAMRESEDAARAASHAKTRAEELKHVVRKHEAEIRDKHTLTRQNRAWIASQIEADKTRAAHQKRMDEVVRNAGGTAMLGAHPVEKNMAARIREKRRNVVVKQA